MHTRCTRRLFGTSYLPTIEVDPHNLHLLGLEMAGRVSLSGVQRKLSLGLDRSRKTLRVIAETSAFILKPAVGEYPSLPENEHLTLLLAALVGLEVPTFGLVKLADGKPALLVRRFDRTMDGRRLPMEDFCQLDGRAPSEKYQGSAEQCLKLLRRHSAEPLVDSLTFFRQVLFAWWVGNDDLHLKNVSLLSREPGRPKLSPAYDLVNTSIIIPNGEMGMTMEGKRKRFTERDWLRFAERARLPPEIVADEAARFVAATKEAVETVRRSFLRDDLKHAYREMLAARLPELESLRDSARETSSRAASRNADPRPLGPEEFARSSHLLRKAFHDLGITLAGWELERDLAELERMGGRDRESFDIDPSDEQERKRAAAAAVKFLRYDRMRKAFKRCEQIAGFRNVVKHLRRLRVPLQTTGDDQAWDLLFEIELAAQLKSPREVKGTLWTLEFREPDLVMHAEEDLAWACKRPRRASSIEGAVAKACEQIERSTLPGVVAVSLDLVLDLPWISVNRPADAADAARSELRGIVDGVRERVLGILPSRGLDPGRRDLGRPVLGVLFGATFAVMAPHTKKQSHWNTLFETQILGNPDVLAGEETLAFLASVLSVGQAELRQEP